MWAISQKMGFCHIRNGNKMAQYYWNDANNEMKCFIMYVLQVMYFFMYVLQVLQPKIEKNVSSKQTLVTVIGH